MGDKIKTLQEATQYIFDGLKSGEIEDGVDVVDYVGAIQEGVILSQPDSYVNFADWTKTKGKNILFVTGLSGSGKSTLATSLAKTHGGQVLELDGFAENFDTSGCHILDQFKKKHPETIPDFEDRWNKQLDGDGEYFIDTLLEFIKFAMSIMYSTPNKLYIIEGIQLYCVSEIVVLLKGKPLVIKGTSAVKSYSRKIKRELKCAINMKENVSMLYQYVIVNKRSGVGVSVKNDKYLTDFKNRMAKSQEPIHESTVISQPDSYANFDEWTKSSGHNILFITGLSGSGKSSLAISLGKSHNADILELDGFQHNFDSSEENILEGFKLKYPETVECFENKWKKPLPNNLIFEDSLILFIKYAMQIFSSKSNKLYIIEGVQLYFDSEIVSILKGKPLIIKGTSALKSYSRQIKREMGYATNIKENLNVLYQYITKDKLKGLVDSSKNDKYLTRFKHNMSKSDEPSHGKLYHVSSTNLDEQTLQPRIPKNFMTENGFEDNKIARISFSHSIDGCLAGMSENLAGKILYVHEPSIDNDLVILSNEEIIKKSHVPDAHITNEVWSMKPTKLKYLYKIKVTTAKKKAHSYSYGVNKADLYFWNYEIVK